MRARAGAPRAASSAKRAAAARRQSAIEPAPRRAVGDAGVTSPIATAGRANVSDAQRLSQSAVARSRDGHHVHRAHQPLARTRRARASPTPCAIGARLDAAGPTESRVAASSGASRSAKLVVPRAHQRAGAAARRDRAARTRAARGSVGSASGTSSSGARPAVSARFGSAARDPRLGAARVSLAPGTAPAPELARARRAGRRGPRAQIAVELGRAAARSRRSSTGRRRARRRRPARRSAPNTWSPFTLAARRSSAVCGARRSAARARRGVGLELAAEAGADERARASRCRPPRRDRWKARARIHGPMPRQRKQAARPSTSDNASSESRVNAFSRVEPIMLPRLRYA